MKLQIARSPGVVENDVLFGLEETLFLAGGAHSVLDLTTAARAVPDISYANFIENIRQRAAWATHRCAGYLHVIFPDKQSIVPHRWPFESPVRLGQLYMDRVPSALPVLYPVGVLQKHSDDVISRIDTHVTDYGSILVAGHIVEQLVGAPQLEMVERLLITVDAAERRSGDLGSKLAPPITFLERYSTARPPGRWLHNDLSGGSNGLVDLRFCDTPVYDRRLVVFGDSFARNLARFFQFWFREVIFFRSGFFDPDLASLCQPDFLITENVERYLDYCNSDTDRPNFFMYPHLGGDSYAPSAEFAAAFSAVLSIPRRPYVDFRLAEFGSDRSKKSGIEILDMPLPPRGIIQLTNAENAEPDIATIEPVRIVPRLLPEFVDNQSDVKIDLPMSTDQDIHGSFLVERKNIFLFGPSIQVTKSGRWSCESRAFSDQFIDMVTTEGFQRIFPGPKPHIKPASSGYQLDFTGVADRIEILEEPLFLATPLEPNNWGRWVSSVIPKVAHFRQYGANRKLLCHNGLPWQRALLDYLGLRNDQIVSHDPGKTFLCHNLMSVEYSVTNMTVSQREVELFTAMRSQAQSRQRDGAARAPSGDRVFISRLTYSSKHTSYRVLQNESELAVRLRSLGFDVIEPEMLDFDEQILAFSNASIVVCLGGAALYNAVFCAPGTSFVTIESSDYFLGPHCNLLSSLQLRHGIIVGTQDLSDPSPVHKRWSVDVDAVCQRIVAFGRL